MESPFESTFEDEFAPNAVFDKPGILAMANAGPHTNGSQFLLQPYLLIGLMGGIRFFGYVIKGMDVVKKLKIPKHRGNTVAINPKRSNHTFH